MKKLVITCISLLLICVLLLNSCGTGSDNGNGVYLVEADSPIIDIVYSENAILDDAPALAQELADRLMEVCGKEFSVYSDKTQAKNDSLIVLADPSDKSVLSQTNELDKGGYTVSKQEDDIVIVAFDNEAMKEAIGLLCDDIAQSLKKSSGGKKISFSFAEHSEAGASDKKVLVDENRIEFYTIVYAAGDVAGREAAQSLCKNLSEVLGVELKVTDDTMPATELEILVGKTNREESTTHSSSIGNKWRFSMGYEYRLIDKKISILGADAENYCVSVGCENFAQNLIKEEVFELNRIAAVKETLKVKYDEFAKRAEGTDVRIMTSNILSEEWGGTAPEPRAELFNEVLEYYKPDVIGVQEVSLKWSVALDGLFENSDYDLIHEKFPGKKTNYSAMIYNTATTELVDSGVRQMSIGNPIGGRNMTWGVFKDKATEKMYMVINTHLDWINTASPDGKGVNTHYSREKETNELIALYKELAAKYQNLDVFLTADWNTEKEQHPFDVLLAGIPVKFSQDLVDNSDWGAKEIDYILATKDSKILTSHVFSTNSKTMGISDHPFGLIDVILK